jgi:hypothetical protein
MKRKILRLIQVLALFPVLAIVTAPLGASPAAAGTDRIEYVAYNIACSFREGKVWYSDDGMMHIKDRVLQTMVISETEYSNGTGQIVGSSNQDPVTGIVTMHGTLEIYPFEKDGWWAGHWSIQFTPGEAGGIARLHGYGPDLIGLSIKSSLTPLSPTQLEEFEEAYGGPPITGVRAETILMFPGGE